MNIYTEYGLIKVKYRNIFNIQLKLWELVHPDVNISIFSSTDDITIHMRSGLSIDTSIMDVLTWNNNSPDEDYYLLQKVLNDLYVKFIVNRNKLLVNDYLWE